MRSFLAVSWMGVVVGIAPCVLGRALPQAPSPVVTAPPTLLSFEESLGRRQEDPDAISLAYVLLTAIPKSIREVAATNIPAASSIINEEFLDDKKPQWFLDLPWDIQVYLVEHFGPAATASPELPSGLESFFTWPSATATQPADTEVPSPTDSTNTDTREGTSASNPTATGSALSSELSSNVPESTSSPSRTESSSVPSQSISTSVPRSSDPTPSETGSSTSKPSSSTTPGLAPDAEDNTDHGLTKSDKIGIGLGVPLGLAFAAGIFAFCILYRRRQRKKREGSIPPSSPGFIPRFAFQDKEVVHEVRDISYPGPGPQDPNEPHQRLLNPNTNASTSFTDLHAANWNEDVIDTSSSGETVPTLNNHPNNPYQPSGPVMAPVLPTHSSNRARGRRTSYTSLHSVAEVSEPDDDVTYIAESPVLPRNTSPSPLRKTSSTGISPSRGLVIPPAIPENATVKRKPIGAGRTPSPGASANPAATMASQSLLHPALRDRSTLPPLFTQHTPPSNSYAYNQSPYVSPIEGHNPLVAHTFSTSPTSSSPPRPQPHPYPQPYPNPNPNPFAYEEDYGPEYSHQHQWHAPTLPPPQPANNFSRPPLRRSSDPDAYIDMVDGLYGNTSLSRYPDPSSSSSSGSLLHGIGKGPQRKGSKTEWPLRNMSMRGMRRGSKDKGQLQGQEGNPLWERVYESP